MRVVHPSLLVLATLVASSSAFAQTTADTIRARLKPGQRVVVTDDLGQQRGGRISSLGNESLALLLKEGQSSEVSYERIVRISRPHDGVLDGGLLGFGVGAAFGAIAACSERYCDWAVITAPFYGAVGLLPGLLIDAAVRHDPVIYQRGRSARVRVAPMLTPETRAAAVAVSW